MFRVLVDIKLCLKIVFVIVGNDVYDFKKWFLIEVWVKLGNKKKLRKLDVISVLKRL